jgi:hypothetical protein
MSANWPLFVNVLILIIYSFTATARAAWPSEFVLWPWLAFVGYLALDHFFDGQQNTARNIARIYMLRQFGARYDEYLFKEIWVALIPSITAPLFILHNLSQVASFLALLMFQGWATAVCAHASLFFLGFVIPIYYRPHLKLLQTWFRLSLNDRETLSLIVHGVDLLSLQRLIDEAVNENRNPQKWWGQVLLECQIREVESEEGNVGT